MIKFILLLMILPGCVDNTYHEYNNDDKQDIPCYSRFGGHHGYCDTRRHE